MKTEITTEEKVLFDRCAGIAIQGARDYLTTHGLTADNAKLAACLSSWMKIKFFEAMADAKAALDCGMTAVAMQTFSLTMRQAGIEAAREASNPGL
jgi:hypothetical protein